MDIPGLKTPKGLAEMVDREAFHEMCESFCELYGVGLHIVDIAGNNLTDIRTNTTDFYEYLLSTHRLKLLYMNLIGELKSCSLKSPENIPRIQSFSGLSYSVCPIYHDGSESGRIIFGPYRCLDFDEFLPELDGVLSQSEKQSLLQLQESIPVISESVVNKVLRNIAGLVDLIVHNSYKAYLTSQMHLATMSAAFDDLESKNNELRYANQGLLELDKLKSNFISTVSHELRTPLTSIIGYSEMLIEGLAGELSEDQNNYVGTILEKGESLLDLIRQVLDLSRIESGKLVLNKSTVEIKSVIEKSISDVLPQAKKNELDIQLDIEPDVTPIVLDADKLRRVLVNLLGNAVKFSNRGSSIRIQASISESVPVGEERYNVFEVDRNRYLSIAVIDEGIGIPAEQVERVFDTFFQVDSSSTREVGGTGLGLSIVRNFVQAHHGKVEVSSDLGVGTTFTVHFPYVADMN